MKQEVWAEAYGAEDAQELDENEEVEKEVRRAKRRLVNAAFRVCRKLMEAFECCGPEMSDMDAADFKDRAAETWTAVLAAREVTQEKRRLEQ